MDPRMSRKQHLVIVGVPLFILFVSAFGYAWFGAVALLLPPVLLAAYIGYLLVELRHYQMRLFVRQSKEGRNQFTQLEAMMELIAVLAPKHPLPPTRGWAASPDMLREILVHVLSERPGLVVEASSGTSTLVIAYALERQGNGRVNGHARNP